MKTTFKSHELVRVLKDAVKIVPNGATNTHRYVLISADKDESRVEITTSSHESSLRQTLVELLAESPVIIEESGACLLPAKELLDIVKKATGDVLFEVKRSAEQKSWTATIRFGRTKFNLSGLDPSEFAPYRNDQEETSIVKVTSVALRTILRQTSYACSGEKTRPILTGVNFRVTETDLTATATDALRLAQMVITAKMEGDETRDLTVPAEPLERLATMIPNDDDEEISLEIGNKAIVASWSDNETRFVMRALEDSYPDVTRIIPKGDQVKSTLQVSRQALLDACHRISIVSGNVDNRLTRWAFNDGRIAISAKSAEVGAAYDEVEILETKGELISPMSFNVRFWTDTLKALDCEKIEIAFVGQNSPITVRPVGNNTLGLISPLHYREETKMDSSVDQTA